MLAAANSCNTGNPFFSFSPPLMTEHSIAPDVCMFAERFKSPVFCSDTQHAAMFLLDQSELFPPPPKKTPNPKRNLPHPVPAEPTPDIVSHRRHV